MTFPTSIYRRLTTKYVRRTIDGEIVSERTTSINHSVPDFDRLSSFKVMATDLQDESVPRRKHYARLPDLNLDRVHFRRFEMPMFVMSMVRSVRFAALWIEFSMRCAQPALSQRRMGIMATLKLDLFAGG